jgi:4-hydroxybenzoate polyprenyltransferase
LLATFLINDSDKSPHNFFLTLVGLTLLAAGVYYINQVFDYDTDLINKKLGFLQSGLIRPREMISAYISVSLIGIIIGGAIGLITFLLFLLIFIAGFIYSAPPFKLKDHPFGGILINGVGFGILVPLSVPGFIENSSEISIYVPAYFLFTSIAGYLLTIIPDRKGDLLSGKMTLAAACSDRFIIGVGLFLLFFSCLCSILMGQYYLLAFSLISLAAFFVAFLYTKERFILTACKLPILLLSVLAGYYYPVYFVFMLVVIILARLYFKKRFGIIYPRIN